MFNHCLEDRTASTKILASWLLLVLLASPIFPVFVSAEGEVPPESTQTEVTPPPPPPETISSNDATGVSEPGTPVVIVTGDAVAESTIVNEVNSNEVQTATGASQSEATTTDSSAGGGSITDSLTTSEETGSATSSPVILQNENQNEAVVENTSVTVADTGGNTGSGGGGALISTGDALASANVVNVVNSNIINSNGFLLFLNSLFGGLGALDLRAFAESFGADTNLLPCEILCDGLATNLETTIANENTATIGNDVIVRSQTGANSADGNAGSAAITTGDAYAAANVINVANTNIVNSNYMMVVFNNFGDWGSDFILPNSDFFSRFFGNAQTNGTSTSLGSSSLAIENENTATVETSVATVAETGGNEANGNYGTTTTATGNALAGSTVLNTVNQNLFGGASIRLIFRVYGDWLGDVFNAPQGVSWRPTPRGLELYDTDNESTLQSTTTPSSATSTDSGGSSEVTIANRNAASIRNNIQVLGLTGRNRVNANRGTSTILTGNASAAANVVNIANTNIIGRNWIYAIVNIFGNWRGNVSFGQPDLWIGGRVTGDGVADGTLTYRFTVANRGDATASNVRLRHDFDRDGLISFDSSSASIDGHTYWWLGTIPAGQSVEVEYRARVSNNLSADNTLVTSTITAESRETDGNLTDNTDILSVGVYRRAIQPGTAGYRVTYTNAPKLSVAKVNNSPTGITASSTVNYTITIKNDGGDAYHAVLIDRLMDAKGKVVGKQTWNLDTLFANEMVEVTYTTLFNSRTVPGEYTNSAQVKAIGRHPSRNPFYGSFADSNVATTSIIVLAPNPVVAVPQPSTSAGTTEENDITVSVPLPEPRRLFNLEYRYPLLIILPQCLASLADVELTAPPVVVTPPTPLLRPQNSLKSKPQVLWPKDVLKNFFGNVFRPLSDYHDIRSVPISTEQFVKITSAPGRAKTL